MAKMLDRLIDRWNTMATPVEQRLCDALRVIECLHDERLDLQRRIHNQRVALRNNWEIIEMRAQYKRAWYPSKLLSAILRRGMKS